MIFLIRVSSNIKHFEFGTQDKTVITREYPADWKRGDEPYYPINDAKNNAIYEQYLAEAERNGRVIFCGRLADYKYYDMHVTVERALDVVEKERREYIKTSRIKGRKGEILSEGFISA